MCCWKTARNAPMKASIPSAAAALDRLMMDAADDPAAREHVTGYFKLHPDFVQDRARRRLSGPGAKRAAASPSTRPTIWLLSKRCMPASRRRAGEASLADLLLLLEREPELQRHQRPCEAETHSCRPAGWR